MAVELNHTIVPARDKTVSAKFLAEILGVTPQPPWGPFLPLRLGNGVTLDFVDTEAPECHRHHYAFLVDEAAFDAALARIRAAGVPYYADFTLQGRGQINHLYGGRGAYFHGPEGHLFELITRPYGPRPQRWSGASEASVS